ncbi:helicase-related protein [Burkholderia pseudomallei]|uniref:helicase-related protein n=1 Tax=Burkholderia pseudomallei TaxID=28450 RepID=UPI0005E3BE73|nr:helicase-related protein [Burkholderia pseudomallei]HDR9587557.1 hypothetical protein [Burkholderia stabilis]ALC58369.1 hypothetical protein AMS56_17140 [Burkholderia pseudomallei]MBD2983927.1 helicase [Burkholderia pseudomallei]MBD3017391.1 helicase [Burkholderia pseudomallei]MBF3390649.1 helicase [Burkholderia pseudomallei]
MAEMTASEAQRRFVCWLSDKMTAAGRGDDETTLDVEPSGKFWLGRLQSVSAMASSNLGERAERLEPCAQGIKLRPADDGPWQFTITGSVKIWMHDKSTRTWDKTETASVTLAISVDRSQNGLRIGREEWSSELARVTGRAGLEAFFEIEIEASRDERTVLAVTLVNDSPKDAPHFRDTRFYECTLELEGIATEPFVLEALEDSFRYDRRIPAYGINCGVRQEGGRFVCEDEVAVDKQRPDFWNVSATPPDCSFLALAKDPILPSVTLLERLSDWGDGEWSPAALEMRQDAEGWDARMREKANAGAKEFENECLRIQRGIELLRNDATLARAFRLMNRAMHLSANGKYSAWRPFQFGFLLANLASIVDVANEVDIADLVWFATGGGKTETYLGLLVTAALHDRLTGKVDGVTAWSRFPLRMLSLQQTQRFADAMAAAELVRREEKIGGTPFAMGFFVGEGATPNRIEPDPKPGKPDPDDDNMPGRYQVLERCPFCHERTLTMAFSRRAWRLYHHCTNEACTWPEEALPIYVVDEEIYRFLPTVVVGTLDKAASISFQAAMRGLVGAPFGICSKPGHGYTYAARSTRKNGCLVPGCQAAPSGLPMEPARYPPSFRLQDELHLLRDSLGAVDSHYEALYDALQIALANRKPKILASSATLTGYEKQVDVLYRRVARVFPVPPPRAGAGFWTAESTELMRRFIAIAPRGVTVEYTVDRLLTELQKCVRRLADDPTQACLDAGVDPIHARMLLDLYGTDVVYGNTLRDLEAVARSIPTQLQASGQVHTASLTGGTDFAEVRQTLERLQAPEDNFDDRLHVLTASSMMSHGVDIDRLNVMVMLGLPLATAEFIQATARVGRRYPALVFVVHKMGRERDAGIFRSFRQFVQQGDRFVEPIPVTRRSRRVLERTLPGLVAARLLAIEEPRLPDPLTTAAAFKRRFDAGQYDPEQEFESLAQLLGLDSGLDAPMRSDIREWVDELRRNLESLPSNATWVSDVFPSEDGPMLSLRDVEKTVPIIGRRV